jgi:hypothetical protein
MASSVRRLVSMRPLGAIGKSALFGSFGWTLRSVGFFVSPESGGMDSPSAVFTTVAADRVLPFLQL